MTFFPDCVARSGCVIGRVAGRWGTSASAARTGCDAGGQGYDGFLGPVICRFEIAGTLAEDDLEMQARARYPAFHRADRATCDLSSLFVRKTIGAHEDERLALGCRQFLKFAFEISKREALFLATALDRLEMGHLARARGAQGHPPVVVEERVSEDRHQPGAKIRADLELLLVADRAKNGVLYQIIGSRRIPREHARERPKVRQTFDDASMKRICPVQVFLRNSAARPRDAVSDPIDFDFPSQTR